MDKRIGRKRMDKRIGRKRSKNGQKGREWTKDRRKRMDKRIEGREGKKV